MYPNIRYYHVLELFGLAVIQLEDTSEILSRADFEQLQIENKHIDFLMR